MRIAFVSFEYPPETAFGGIATYVEQAARMLAARGHEVEVFAGGPTQITSEADGVQVHRVACLNPLRFYHEIFPAFAERHRESPFDVVESPDYKHDGYWVAKKLPDLPHVLRLHSGTGSSSRLFRLRPEPRSPITFARQCVALIRAFLGACRRGWLSGKQDALLDYLRDVWNPDVNDCRTAQLANLVASPCLDLLKFQMREWHLNPDRIALLPYVYFAAPTLLKVPVGTQGKTVGFFGQMSERKGLRFLGEAFPAIFAAHPEARFKFVGRDFKTIDGRPWPEWLREKAGTFADRLEFAGHVPLAEMASEYGQVDVCVFPSIWENFPNVCLEAMNAGRPVAGSWSGGMAEMLDHGRCGLLFPPRSPAQLARVVCELLADGELCAQLGERARARVLECYSRDVIAPQHEEMYRRAIALHRQRRRGSPAHGHSCS